MMLGQLKEIACQQGLTELLVTASEGNEASIRTILANGGRFEKKVTDPATGETFCHYWLETSQRELLRLVPVSSLRRKK